MAGQKFSEGKLPINTLISRQFNRAIREVARATLGGHLKYLEQDRDWMNWSRVENANEQYMEAAARHLLESAREVWNPDMKEYGGVRHKASIIWNLLASLELDLIEEERIKNATDNFILNGGMLPTTDVSRLEGLSDNSDVKVDEKNWTWSLKLSDEQKEEFTKIPKIDKGFEEKLKNFVTLENQKTNIQKEIEEYKRFIDFLQEKANENGTTCYEEWEKEFKRNNPWYPYGENPYHPIPRLKADELIDKQSEKDRLTSWETENEECLSYIKNVFNNPEFIKMNQKEAFIKEIKKDAINQVLQFLFMNDYTKARKSLLKNMESLIILTQSDSEKYLYNKETE